MIAGGIISIIKMRKFSDRLFKLVVGHKKWGSIRIGIFPFCHENSPRYVALLWGYELRILRRMFT